MAASKSRGDFSASILAGSEETLDFYCQPCDTEHLSVEAVNYCQNCCEYLCHNCCKVHGKLSATKDHLILILDKSAMSKSKEGIKVRDVLTETCSKHGEKVMEYFCNVHSQICCHVCLTLNHSTCSDKSYIPDISDAIKSSAEYKRLKEDIDRLISLMANEQKRLETYKKDNDKLRSKVLTNIKDFRKQINTLLNKLEEDARRRVNAFHAENTENVTAASDKVKTVLSEITTLKSDLTLKEKDGKNNQLFVLTKVSRDRINVIDSTMKELSTKKFVRYTFRQEENIQQMMSTLSTMWSQSLRQDGAPAKVRYVREVNVKSKNDTNDCYITGIAVLDKDRVVVSDYQNMAVKLIDMKANQIASCLSLSSEPHDVTEMTPSQVAVVLASTQKIEIITVTDVLSTSHTSICTPATAIIDLCYDGSNFITACERPSSIKIIDMSGKVLNTFDTDSNGKQLFAMPAYIAIGPDKNMIYVTDNDANTVTSMTTTGSVISVYMDEKLQSPLGATAGRDGAVYVCSHDTHTIHQLSATGVLTRILLGQDQGLARHPGAIAYREEEDRVYISSWSTAPEECNYIRLYQLE